MAEFIYDDLDEDQLISFIPGAPNNDFLSFDHPLHQAGHLLINFQGGNTRVSVDFGPAPFGNVILDGIMPEDLAPSNFNFVTSAGLGLVLIGDQNNSRAGDSGNNTLTGTVFGDFLMGLGGNDVMTGDFGDDMFSFSPGGLPENAQYGNDTVSGGDGFDWLYFQSTPAVNVNFVTGHAISTSGDVSFTGIEAVSGTGGNDTFVGNDEDNFFDPVQGNDSVSAAGGDDTILGFEGDDTYDGGTGTDWVQYDEAEDPLLVDLEDGSAGISDHSSHTLISIENILGSAFDDEIFGDENANVLDGSWGEDELAGRGGNDTLIGGGGNDGAEYRDALTGVVVNLSAFASHGVQAGRATDGLGGIDMLIGLAGAEGSAFNDTMIGGAYVDSFMSGGGNDSLIGGAGMDELVYENAAAAIHIDLQNSIFQDGDGGNDFATGFEVVFASDHNDTLTGDGQANSLHGLSGNDTIQGLGGNDTLLGGEGADVLTGGAESDVFWFFRRSSEDLDSLNADVITDFASGTDKIRLNPAALSALNPVNRTLAAAEFDAETDSVAEEADDRIIYNTSTGDAFYDADGSGVGAAVLIFTLTGSLTLQASDFDLTNVIRWSDLIDGDQFGGGGNLPAFNVDEDIIHIDDAKLSAADFYIDGSFTGIELVDRTKAVALSGISIKQLHGGNLTFADGSVLRLGDESISTTGDDNPNTTLTGGAGNDLLIGAGGDDSLAGGAGNDAFALLEDEATGAFGHDTLDGGAGSADFVDFISNADGNGAFFVMGNETQGGSITELDGPSNSVITLIGIEGILGTDGNDEFEANDQTLVTGRSTDIIQFFEGFDGDDLFYGAVGDGRVTYVSYRNSEGGVAVNLGEGFGDDAAGGVDDFDPDNIGVTRIDGVVGSHFTDFLVGGTNSRDAGGRLHEFFEGLAGIDFIDGGDDQTAGADRVDYTSSPFRVVVNLANTFIMGNFYGTGNIALGGGTARDGWSTFGGDTDILLGIEEARGSEFDDTLVGGGENERFEGLGGNDFIFGTNGFTGEDNDFVAYTSSTEAVYVNLGSGIGRGLADSISGGTVGIDTLVSIESARGSDWDDSLVGANGGENVEELEGGPGNDTLDGGAIGGARDFNIASYAGAPAGVVGNLSATTLVAPPNTAVDGYGNQDTLVRINAFAGSSFNDTLLGGVENNGFDGRAGDDIIDGGDGSDWVFYGAGSFEVEVDLGLGLAFDDWGSLDNLSSIENVMGTSFDDFIIGSSGANILDGGEGFDELVGGAGADTFVYSAPADIFNNKLITDFASVEGDRIHLNRSFLPGLTADGPLTAAQFDIGLGNGYLSTTRIIYDQTGPQGVLYYDADGNGASSAIAIAILEDPLSTGGPSLVASDFMVFNVGALSMFNWSELSNGAVLVFDPEVDQLVFDDPGISAADLLIESEDFTSTDLTYGGKTVTLNVSPFALTTTNVTFQNGSRLVIGDNDDLAVADDGPNTVIGGAGDDMLIGAGGADSVFGAGGNDTFMMVVGSNSRYGNDTLNGGNGGQDRIIFGGDGNSGVTINLATGLGTGNDTPASSFRLIDIEAATGTLFNDTFTASSSTAINGLRSDINQRFEGEGGNDTINGATGDGRITTAEYRSATVGVTVNLGAGTASDGLGGTDTLNNVDGVVGSDFADLLVGGSQSRSLTGGLFEFFEGLAGDDTINGGSGTDRVIYINSPGAVNVNLQTDTASDGYGGTDTLSSIEHVRGSEFNDTIIGQAGQNNQIEGLGGDDSLVGGGDEEDLVSYIRASEAVYVSLQEGRGRSLTDSIAGGSIGIDTISGFQGIRGSDFGDHLIGADGTGEERYEFLEGHAGSDTLNGGVIVGELDFNLASYERSPTGAIINLSSTTQLGVLAGHARDGYNVNGNAAGIDVLNNINVGWGSNFADTMVGGSGNEMFVGRGGDDVLAGGAGIDTLDHDSDGSSLGVIVNMTAGSVTVGGVAVAAGRVRDEFGGTDVVSGFEVVVGTERGDFIAGGNEANVLEGLEGNDTLLGGGSTDTANDTLLGAEGDDFLRQTKGHDLLDGGEGFDWVQFVSPLNGASAAGSVYTATGNGALVNLGEYTSNPDRINPNSANDSFLVSIEAAVGTPGADLLIGGSFASANSGTFSEAFRPGAGNDTVHGANMRTGPFGVVDRVDYTDMSAGVIVNFGTQPYTSTGGIVVQGGTARDATGGIDTLFHIDWALGSNFNDELVGGNPLHDGFERFEGRAGNDTIRGGSGSDEATYQNSPTAVVVNLGLGTASDGHGATDTLIDVERVRGSAFNDTLIGSDGSTDEMFTGDGGSDLILGGTGSGVDFASWQTSSIENNTGLNATLDGGSATVSYQGAGTDTLVDIEGIIGTNHHHGDTLVGGQGDQTFVGRAGDDSIDGGSGNETHGDTASYMQDPTGVIVNLSNADATVSLQNMDVTVASGTARDGWGDTWLVPHGDVLTLGISGEGEIEFRKVADPQSAIVGSWFHPDAGEAHSMVVITFLSDGTYMLAEDGDSVADPSGQDGMERGTYTWNGTDLTIVTTVNTNGEWGLSDDPPETAVISGGGNILTFDGEFALTRVGSDDPLVGGWYISGEDGEDPAVLTILGDGSFMFAEEEVFDDPGASSGMERGTFVRDPVTGLFNATVDLDTNGDIGVSSLHHGTDTLLNIENATGSSFNDTLVGGMGNNRLSGLGGDDEFWIRGDGVGGASGNDSLDGGDGHDHVSYQNVQGVALNVNFQSGHITGGDDDGSDILVSNIESAAGTQFADTFTASSNTSISGLRTDATQEFQGMAGNDTLIGAQGQARGTLAAYFDSPFAVVVNLSNGSLDGTLYGSVAANTARDGWDSLGGGTDVFDTTNGANIDGAYGSAHDDILFGGQFGSASINLYNQFFEGMGGDDTIVGGEEGNHALVAYDFSPNGITVDFNTGTVADGWGDTDTLVNIRHVRGSAFNDSFVGRNEDREEWFEGGDGNDTIDGGAQGDNVLYTQATGGVFVSLAAGIGRALDTIGGAGVGVDELKNIEFIHGSDFADSLIGGGAGGQPGPGQSLADFEPWEVALFFGSEEIQGRAGNDTIDGGDTNPATLDIAEYRSSPGAVIVNLSAATAFGVGSNRANDGYGVNGNPAGIDVLVRMNGAGGSQFNDTLVGGAGNEFFAGRGGNDTIIGGAGIDIASYESGGSVTVNLGSGFNLEGVFVDSLSGIENILGSSFNDTISGDNGANLLIGEGGNDTLSGGDSTVSGAGANDTLFGGEGDDQFIQTRGKDSLVGGEGNLDFLTYNVGTLAAVNVNLALGTSNAGGHIATVSGIERIHGTAGNDTLAGGDLLHAPGIEGGVGEIFRPFGGNDFVTGMAGAGWTTVVEYSRLQNGSEDASPIFAVLGNSNNVGFVFDGSGGFDTLIDVDHVRGSEGNDTLIGGSYSASQSGTFFESFRGNAGDDLIDGGGSDTVLGSLGTLDRAEYGNNTAAQAVFANIGTTQRTVGAFTVNAGEAMDGRGGTDTLIDIDVLQGGAGDDTLVGGNASNDSFERFEGRGGNDFIDGGSGNDEADYSSSADSVTVDLSNPTGFAIDGLGGNDTLENIEWARGSDFNDTLIGGAGESVRLGGGIGDDSINGGSGNGVRYASFSFAGGGAIGYLGASDTQVVVGDVTVTGGTARDGQGGVDELENINGLWGSGFSDTLFGGAGDDFFRGQGRGDIIDGGEGEDTVLYLGDPNPSGVIVNLGSSQVVVGLETIAGGTARDGWGGIWGIQGVDTLISIENIVGSTFGDLIIASTDGTRVSGRGGNDTLRGGDGEDTIDYSDAGDPVNVNLQTGTAQDGEDGTDTLLGTIERVIGSDGNDTLTGRNDPEGASEVFVGGAGNDAIDGGSDTLLGGGIDFASYADATGAVTATIANGSGVITAAGLGTDTLTNIAGLIGSSFDDNLSGGASNDYFRGLAGNDLLNGGEGIDTADYSDDEAGVVVNLGNATFFGQGPQSATDGSGDIDTLSSIENAAGSDFDDVLIGSDAVNIFGGAAGDDFLIGGDGEDFLRGGEGNDTASYETSGLGVSADLGVGQVRLATNPAVLLDTVNDIENVIGSDANDTLIGDGDNNLLEGGNGDDSLVGNAGNDTLDGGANDFGGDTMEGGTGDDVYHIDDSADIANLVELLGEGTDTLVSTVSLTLGANQSIEIIRYEGPGGGGIFGNAGANTIITRNDGNTMGGDDGSDTIAYLDEIDSITIDLESGTATGAGGTDTLFSFENAIGGGGGDTLQGSNGENILDGGAGADSMNGGAGEDTYFVDDKDDVVVEENPSPPPGGMGMLASPPAGSLDIGGIADLVIAAVSYSINHLQMAGVENLTLSASSLFAIAATGNALDNEITGNGIANTLEGGAGADTLDGGDGVDTAKYASAAAGIIVNLGPTPLKVGLVTVGVNRALDGGVVIGDSTAPGAVDTLISIENIVGSGHNDRIVGSTGNNVFDGGAGNDTLVGGAGIDAVDYSAAEVGVIVNLSSASVVSGGVTVLKGTASDGAGGTDSVSQVESVIGSEKADFIAGSGSGDILDGGAGNDTLSGGAGNDTYFVDAAGDVIREPAKDGGVDTVVSTVSHVLGSVFEHLILTGSADINATGNALGNQLTGNSGANILLGFAGNDVLSAGGGSDFLDGGIGNDVMTGGAGDDTYVFNVVSDRAIENAGQGDDTVVTPGSFSLLVAAGANIENISLTGVAAVNATGNALVNILHGNAGANIIIGDGGSDVMTGGGGNDIFIIGAGHHTQDEFLDGGLGVDTIRFTSTTVDDVLTLSAGVAGIENVMIVTAAGAANTTAGLDVNASAVGGNLAITGNAGDNVLTGGAGDDTLIGGGGVDTLTGGEGFDALLIDVTDAIAFRSGPTSNLDGTRYNGGADRDVAIYSGSLAGTITLASNFVLEGVRLATGAGVPTAAVIHIDASAITTNGVELVGNNAGNILTGTEFGDVLTGNAGNDTLNGGADTQPGNGNLMNGGAGTDSMTGGINDDTFLFMAAAEYTAGETIFGGLGDLDTLVYAGTTAGVFTLKGALVTGIEEFNISSAANVTVNAAEISNAIRILGGSGNDSLTGSAGSADSINGGGSNDTLVGSAGDGTDTLNGGTGNDVFLVESTNHLDLIDGGEDVSGLDLDVIRFTGTAANPTLVLNESLLSNVEQVVIAIAAGATTGTTALNVDASGIDSVGGYSLSIVGNNGANVLTGTHDDAGDVLIGNAGNDTLVGGIGADVLIGGAGADSLMGGADNDTFIYASLAEFSGDVIDGGDSNFDTLRYTGAAATLKLGTAAGQINPLSIEFIRITDAFGSIAGTAAVNVDASAHIGLLDVAGNNGANILTGTVVQDTLTGNGGNDVLKGGEGEDSLSGGDGNDTLTGGKHADTLLGGAGNDIFNIDNLEYLPVEDISGGDGSDTIRFTSTTIDDRLILSSLVAGIENVMIVSATGAANATAGLDVNASQVTGSLAITGNAAANELFGGSGNDTLMGGAGNDELSGGAGNDSLVGGVGADAMAGGQGDDTYVVDSLGDNVLETLDEGIDTIQYVVAGTHAAPVYVEKFTVTGAVVASVTGNELDNAITGSTAANTLNGGLGNDVLSGGAGNDTLSGEDGRDTITGGAGADSMTGGDGNDTFLIGSAAEFTGDRINGGGQEEDGGIDDILYTGNAAANLVLSALVMDIEGVGIALAGDVGLGTAAINLDARAVGNGLEIFANDGNNILTGTNHVDGDAIFGNGGNDVLTGGGGADFLSGGDGNDILVWDPLDEAIDGGTGNDTLRLDGATQTLDLRDFGSDKFTDIEIINITGRVGTSPANNTLKLDVSDVLDMSSVTDTLRIDGNAGDKVNLTGWTQGANETIGANTYASFTQTFEGQTATLLIDLDIGRSPL